jgi:hypothetical protein
MHSNAMLLAISHCKTLREAMELIPRAEWGLRYPLVHNGWVIGLVDLVAPEAWYKAAANADGFRSVPGRWKLVPHPTPIRHTVGVGQCGDSHAILEPEVVKEANG